MTLNLAKHVYAYARTHPRRLALAGDGQSLDYAELAQRAANLAAVLRDRLPSSGETRPMVGILASRSVDACVAVLGCAWAGATYVPIGTKLPEDRIRTLLSRCKLAALVADAQGSRSLPAVLRTPDAPAVIIAPRPDRRVRNSDRELLDLTTLPAATPWPPLYEFQPDDLAYVMFTSGTTGVPKGVMISQAAAGAFVEMIGMRLALRPEDRTLEVTELGFDVSVLDMFATWQAGASLHTLPAVRVMNAVSFAREARITVWSSTPSLIALLRQIKALEPNTLPDVRLAIFIGEPLSKSVFAVFRAAAPRCIVDDLYGPTEATVVCTGQRISDSDYVATPHRDVISIGKALPGTTAVVLNAVREVAAVGEAGELALAGVQLATGYLDAPELTEARFPVIGGIRFYLTGDAACRDEHGMLHHLGRLDHQVKILGNRVELEEIETHLREVTGLSLAVALPWPTLDGVHQGVVAFLSGSQPYDDGAVLSAMRARLPAYMVPSRLVWVDTMPLNSNGKTDRRALLEQLAAADREAQ